MTVITVMVVAVDVGWICVVVVIVVMFMVVVMMMFMVVVVTGLMHKINVVAMRCLTLMCYVFRTTSRVHGN